MEASIQATKLPHASHCKQGFLQSKVPAPLFLILELFILIPKAVSFLSLSTA